MFGRLTSCGSLWFLGITLAGATACSGVPADACSVGSVSGASGVDPCAASGGLAGTGGAVATGGSQATGGAVATGGSQATGGAVATGGSQATGGAVATGGSQATGGAVATGGSQATGGAVATGGSQATGGAVATGGFQATGGAVASGGLQATGGLQAAGGSSGAANACVVYVKVGGSDTSDGSSWNLALATVQKGLNTAATKVSSGSCANSQVWVAAGIYFPTETSPLASGASDARNVTIMLKARVALYGGFAGTESSLSERIISSHKTTLSGDLGTTGEDTDNAFHVVTGVTGATIDGFTITLGNAPSSVTSMNTYGGGMYNQSASPTVANCVFDTNFASMGGAMYNYMSSSPSLTNCVFTNNSANYSGGAIYNYASSPIITNCKFLSNVASNGGGGGIYNISQSSPTIDHSVFASNRVTSGDGGAIYSCNSCVPTVSACELAANMASNGGGAIFSYSATPFNVVNSRFRGNSAGYGGGIFNFTSSPNIVNCSFSDNFGNHAGAGVYNYALAAPNITNCIFWGNRVGASIVSMTNVSASYPTVTYSDVQGGCSTDTDCTTDNTGNIDADPLFVNVSGSDLILQANSPCVDAASMSVAPAFDILGNPRVDVPSVGNDGGNYADMGAYEYQP